MSEPTAFEARLQAALRRHVAAGPTEVDALGFARMVTAAEPRRHGLARALTWRHLAMDGLPWRRSAVLPLAWLVLVALLLAALGAALFVGSHRSALAFACPTGTDPDKPGPVEQTRPPVTYAGSPMAFDRAAGRIVAVFGSAGGLYADTWIFDVCTNTWARRHPVLVPADGWRLDINVLEPYPDWRLVYDVDSDRTIALGERVWSYDLRANTWTVKAPVPASLHHQPRLVYDSKTGRIIAQSGASAPTDPWELWSYDVDTDAWTPIPQSGGPAVPPDRASQVLAYDPSVDRLVSYDARSKETWLFDLGTNTWSRSGAVTPSISFGYGTSGGEVAYDETSQRTIVASMGRVIAYDASADRWDVLAVGWDPETADVVDCSGSICRWNPSTVYDPVNRRLVVQGGRDRVTDGDTPEWTQARGVLALDTRTGRWLTLLSE